MVWTSKQARMEETGHCLYKVVVAFCLLIAGAGTLHAQDDPEYRMEVGVGGGMVGYLGDFNGNLTKDLQGGVSLLGRYNFNPWMALRLNFGYGKLKGSSSDTKTYYPEYVDNPYSFSNKLYDLSVTYEYNFWPYGTGWDYRGAKRITPYVFGGLGLAFAKTEIKTHTGVTVPLGLGVKFKVAERVNLGVEWAMNFTTNDYFDEAKDPYGIESSGLFKNTDCFSRLQVTLTYSFSPKCVNCNKE